MLIFQSWRQRTGLVSLRGFTILSQAKFSPPWIRSWPADEESAGLFRSPIFAIWPAWTSQLCKARGKQLGICRPKVNVADVVAALLLFGRKPSLLLSHKRPLLIHLDMVQGKVTHPLVHEFAAGIAKLHDETADSVPVNSSDPAGNVSLISN